MKTAVSISRLVIFLILSLSFPLIPFTTATNSTTTNPPPPPSSASSGAADIQKACSIAKDKPFCVQTLTSNPKSHNLTLKDLSFLAMTMAQESGTATSRFVSQKLGDENNLQPMLDESLGDCEDMYEDAVAMLENAMSAFFTKGKAEVTKWLSAAMADARNCEEGLRKSGTQGAMGNRNHVFYKLVSSALSVYDAAVPDSNKHVIKN